MCEQFNMPETIGWEDTEDFLTLEEAGLENPPERDNVCNAQYHYYQEEGDH